MKLISIQSRGDRTVRILKHFKIYKVLMKRLYNNEITGFLIELRDSANFWSKREAIKEARVWLKGAND